MFCMNLVLLYVEDGVAGYTISLVILDRTIQYHNLEYSDTPANEDNSFWNHIR